MRVEGERIADRGEGSNMRCYGSKPAWFGRDAGGLLPVVELDGRLITDSVSIMLALEREFGGDRSLLPPGGVDDIRDLMGLEREPVWQSNLQPDFNVSVFECFDTRISAVLRELDKSNRSIQKISRIDSELTELENFKVWSGRPKPVGDFHTTGGGGEEGKDELHGVWFAREEAAVRRRRTKAANGNGLHTSPNYMYPASSAACCRQINPDGRSRH